MQDTVPGPQGPTVIWKPLGKSVRNFPRYMEIARSSNLRYLDALAPVQDSHPSYTQIGKLVQSQEHAGRRYAGCNVAKIPRSHRWRASILGQHLLTKVIRLYYHGLSQAA